jgi:3-deoxy-D-manno-octulosonic-acid transferase
MFLLYDLAVHLAVLFSLPYALVRAYREPRFREGWRERFGILPQATNPLRLAGIWVQAVSVGEVMLARVVIGALRERRPDLRCYLTTTTATGRDLARRNLQGRTDALCYFPLDLRSTVRRTCDRLQPALFVALETEIWPNLLRLLAQRSVPAVIVNGRISPAAFGRYRRARFFFRRVLRHLDLALMQTEEDAERLIALGMDPQRVKVTGNLKFDVLTPEAGDPQLERALGIRAEELVFIAGSTMLGEEEMVLAAFEAAVARRPEALLILAPRHPERWEEVAALLSRRGVPFVRRSALAGAPFVARRVLLLDSLGELPRLYARGRVIFVGGSLVPRGGHNVLEPAAHGRPVIFGPHMDNFREVAERLLAGGGAVQVEDGKALTDAFRRMATDDSLFHRSGDAARQVVEANRGALDRTLSHLEPFLRRFAPASC